jgi:GntR family L-lactate dehydrogenase operon transcriptional regulator
MRISDQIADQLQALIASAGLKVGERLPAERQLAADLGASRSSVREAIQKLASQGLLQSRRGGGTYVLDAQMSQWPRESVVDPLSGLFQEDPEYRYDVLEARHALEGSTAWHAALRATAQDKARIRECFEATLRFQVVGDPCLASRSDAQFHLAIAEASHNLVLLQMMRGLFDLLQATVTQNREKMYTVPETFGQLTNQHQELMQAILDGDAERARATVWRHLEYVHNSVRTLDEDEARRKRSTRLPSISTKS